MTEGTRPRRMVDTVPGRTNAVPIDEDLETPDDVAPPAYGEHHDQLQFSQAGFAADASVTANGRVNIHINEKNRRLSELLAPALKRQLRTETQLPSGPLPPAYIPPSLGGEPGQTPPPRLNVVIQIVGSRGDVQPFIALGQVLRDTYGHRVRVATHANFRSFVEQNGLEFFNIGGDPAQLMAFMVKNPGLMPGLDTLKSGDIKRRRQEIEEILMGCWRSCIEAGDGMGVAPPQHRRDEPLDQRFVLPGNPGVRPFVADAIIANPPSFAHIHIAEKLGIPLHMMFTMPWTPTRAFPHPLADIVATNADAAITNYVSYALVEMMTWQGLGDVINRFRTNILELDAISLLWAPGLLNRLRIPATYCWSPALTPKPADWTQEITVSGFYFLNLESNYTPEPELAAFLAAGPPPVYIGFGSIVVDDPDGLTQTIFRAIIKSGVRALVSKGWGGIGGEAADVPEGVFMLGNCPHDWLFRHVSAVVHHGGAGTTAAGINAGTPTVVVPFFGDQIFWGSMVAKAGAGPAPIPYKNLTAENLAAAIENALQPQTQTRARELGERIKEEKGADVGAKSFHQFLNTDNMRCSLAPSRVAVWRVRRSKVRLSALAAAVLVKQGWLKYSDLKLYRSIEHNTEEQPWDPISAVTMALVGDIGALTMALADFPREVFKGAKAKKDKESADVKDGATNAQGVAPPATSGAEPEAGPSSQRGTDSHSETPSILTPATTHSLAETPIQSPTPSTTTTGLSSQPSKIPPPLPPRSPSGVNRPSTPTTSTPNPVNLDVAIAAGKGVGRIVGAGMKFHTNFCLGLARGFRNAPRLYNDETVRPTEKVTGLVSGVRVAGKEFGLGVYDGISGLVTQPLKGAEKEGGRGFVKGIGKGIGGLVLKNAAAIWSLPAYTFQGVQTEVRNLFARSSANYIITSRVLQGEEDLAVATTEEGRDVLARWQTRGEDLKGFYMLKQREGEKAKEAAAAVTGGAAGAASAEEEQQRPLLESPPRSGRLNLPKRPWSRRRTGSNTSTNLNTATTTTTTSPSPSTVAWSAAPTAASSASSDFSFEDNESLERAIQQSVVQTSTGDREEDAMVEAAIRASLMEMRKVAAQQQQEQQEEEGPAPAHGQTGWIADQKIAPPEADEKRALTDEEWTNITDEEYQALIEEAVRQSLLLQEAEQRGLYHDYHPQQQQQQQRQHWAGGDEKVMDHRPPAAELPGDFPSTTSASTPFSSSSSTVPIPATNLHSQTHIHTPSQGQGPAHLPPDNNNNMTSENNNAGRNSRNNNNVGHEGADGDGDGDGDGDEDEDEQLRRALRESAREHRGRAAELARQRTEEEIVLEYVKRQSLAEEEFRRRGKANARREGLVPFAGSSAAVVDGSAAGSGLQRAGSGLQRGGKGQGEQDEDEDEDLRRAIEESLKMGGGGRGGGPSGVR